MQIEPSEELAYWIGVVQSDGCLRKKVNKKNGKVRYIVSLRVGRKSIPMLEQFQRNTEIIFNRKVKYHQERKREMWGYYVCVKTLLQTFRDLDITFRGPFMPPDWVTSKDSFFGAYLAGIIDGDGDVRIKRDTYPQCVVRISDGFDPTFLSNYIKYSLECSVYITYIEKESEIDGRKFIGHSYRLEFYVSSKNYKFVQRYILPYITLNYKKEKIENYIKSRWPQ